MCKFCHNNYNNIDTIYIDNCNKITKIVYNKKLESIHIEDCSRLVEISGIYDIKNIFIEACENLIKLPYKINNLKYLNIGFCPKIIKLPKINNLEKLDIFCQRLRNIKSTDKLEIRRYLSILRITRWYKWQKRLKVLWRIAEYYSAKKYSPENVLKYMNLEDK